MRELISSIAGKGRKVELLWRYGFNLVPSVRYRFGSETQLGGEAARVLRDLDRDGIAISTVDALFEDLSAFGEMDAYVSGLLEERSEELDEIRKLANEEDAIGQKTFNIELLGSVVDFDPENAVARFALTEELRKIANAYLGMIAKLRYYNVWNTFASKGKARESQLWHFDREDNYIFKVFLYLKDIDEGHGPFTYAPGTHRKGALRTKEPEYFLEGNVRRSSDEQMSAVVPEKRWVRGTGKKGTIIFADTRGMHKGGEARTGDRLMFTCMFTSPASDSRRLIRFPNGFDPGSLNEDQIAALEIGGPEPAASV